MGLLSKSIRHNGHGPALRYCETLRVSLACVTSEGKYLSSRAVQILRTVPLHYRRKSSFRYSPSFLKLHS